VFFQTDYDKIVKNQLWCHFSDVIVITLPKNETRFFHFEPFHNQNFWLRQWCEDGCSRVLFTWNVS